MRYVHAFPLAHRLLACAIALLVALALPGGPARASAGPAAPPPKSAAGPTTRQEPAAAVLPLSVEGEVSDADRERLQRSLLDGLTRGAFRVIPPADVRSKAGIEGPCSDAACLTKVAEATGASHIVGGTVTIEDRDYRVALALYDGGTGSALARTEEGCEICGIADAEELVATAAATLRTKLEALARGPSKLSIASEPAGAVVTIDGEIAGTTPVERELVPGKHVVRVSKEGHISVEREVTLVEGVEEQIRFTLEKVPSRLPKRPWGYASLVIGFAALGTGVAFTALHDRPYKLGDKCSGDNVDRRGNCRYLWDTKWYGMAGVLAGAALVTLGVAVLLDTAGRKASGRKKAKKRRRKKKAAFRPSIGVGPGNVVVRGRF